MNKGLLIAFLTLAFCGAAIAQTRGHADINKDPYEKVIWDELRQSKGIPEFVARLHRISSVSNVYYNPMVLLTTYPPRQWVSFDLARRHYRFLLSDPGSVHSQVVVVSQERSDIRQR